MSWDVWVFDFPLTAATPTDIPDQWVPPKIGRRLELVERIKTIAPEVVFSDSDDGTAAAYGRVKDGLEIRVPGEGDEELNCFVMTIRGDERAVDLAIQILDGLGLRGADTASGGFLERGPSAAERVRNWNERVDSIFSRRPDEEKPES